MGKSFVLKIRKKIGDAELIKLGGDIVENITDNANFVGLKEDVTTATKGYNDYVKATKIAATGTAAQKAIAKKAKADCIVLLNGLGGKVNAQTSDRDILLTTGFILNKDTRTSKVVVAITNFKVSQGLNAGEIIVSYKVQKAIKNALVELTYGDGTTDAKWEVYQMVTSKLVIPGLTSGKVVTLRIKAAGSRSQKVQTQNLQAVVGF